VIARSTAIDVLSTIDVATDVELDMVVVFRTSVAVVGSTAGTVVTVG
jgi:hypothetical protein